MHEFIAGVVLRHLGNARLDGLGDAALLDLPRHAAFTTDSFVVKPLFFPGGDIGTLCVAGTVNDLVVSGARPLFLSLGLILEEGLPMADLERILASMRRTADAAGVTVVTGDTKVVRKGEADGIYVNTAGIGEAVGRPETPRPGDILIVTGSPGDHGVAIMVARREFEFEGDVRSDCAALTRLLPLWESGDVRWMRDITRGGLATVACEMASQAGCTAVLREADVPFSPPVRGVAEILGIEPLYLPSEGKALIVAPSASAGRVLEFLRTKAACPDAAAIGTVETRDREVDAILRTQSGGHRILEPLTGELLPRIC